ncbi:hypothetical protein [Chroococcidiopsis sp.]
MARFVKDILRSCHFYHSARPVYQPINHLASHPAKFRQPSRQGL